MIEVLFITNEVQTATAALAAGADRIFVDTERLGKEDRQKGLNLPLNTHVISDVGQIKRQMPDAPVLVRINPPHKNTNVEIEQAIDCGADIIMLPYFSKPQDVERFIRQIDGRIKSNLLLETHTALLLIDQIVQFQPNEIHLGLNDLKLCFNLDNTFEILTTSLFERVCQIIKENGISLGIGGIGSISQGADIDPKLILNEYNRLGSERVILSRSFTNSIFKGPDPDLEKLKREIKLIKDYYTSAALHDEQFKRQTKIEFSKIVRTRKTQ